MRPFGWQPNCWTRADIAVLAALHASGLRPCDIARKMGLRPRRVLGKLRTLGLTGYDKVAVR